MILNSSHCTGNMYHIIHAQASYKFCISVLYSWIDVLDLNRPFNWKAKIWEAFKMKLSYEGFHQSWTLPPTAVGQPAWRKAVNMRSKVAVLGSSHPTLLYLNVSEANMWPAPQNAYIWEPVTGTCQSSMDTCLHTMASPAIHLITAPSWKLVLSMPMMLAQFPLIRLVLGQIPMDHSHSCKILSTYGHWLVLMIETKKKEEEEEEEGWSAWECA